MYKIKYDCLFITAMSEETEDGRLMDAIANSDELEIFNTALVRDVVDFKWENFAGSIHYFGAFMHFFYAVILLFYIKYMFVILQAIDADGMVPTNLMKNTSGNRDYFRHAVQYTIRPDLRYRDPRIYPHADGYTLTAQGICLLF